MKIDTRLVVDCLAIDEAICASIRKLTKDKRSEFSEMCSLTKLTCQAIDFKGIGLLVMDGTGLAYTSERSTFH